MTACQSSPFFQCIHIRGTQATAQTALSAMFGHGLILAVIIVLFAIVTLYQGVAPHADSGNLEWDCCAWSPILDFLKMHEARHPVYALIGRANNYFQRAGGVYQAAPPILAALIGILAGGVFLLLSPFPLYVP